MRADPKQKTVIDQIIPMISPENQNQYLSNVGSVVDIKKTLTLFLFDKIFGNGNCTMDIDVAKRMHRHNNQELMHKVFEERESYQSAETIGCIVPHLENDIMFTRSDKTNSDLLFDNLQMYATVLSGSMEGEFGHLTRNLQGQDDNQKTNRLCQEGVRRLVRLPYSNMAQGQFTKYFFRDRTSSERRNTQSWRS